MSPTPRRILVRASAACLAIALLAVACGDSTDSTDAGPSDGTPSTTESVIGPQPDETATDDTASDDTASDETASDETASDETASDDSGSETESQPETAVVDGGETSTFLVEVWADNWMAVHIDGQLIGEDSVPITTERSFNAEEFTFEASYPFTVAIEAKDFKETDSGIEYIGEANQQIGDGGLIAQITDTATGGVVATTSSEWQVLVVHLAPLNAECVDDPNPDDTCGYEISETPTGWSDVDFDDSGWDAATEWSAAAVSPKDGYGDIEWDENAQFIWGPDLEIDNTILTRLTVYG